jgi:hypothetical protein
VAIGGVDRFHIKQFPSEARGWFEREKAIQSSGSSLVVAPAITDPFDLIIVSPAGGRSWWSCLAQGEDVGVSRPFVQDDHRLSQAISDLGGAPIPPIDRWLKLQMAGLSTAQRRLVTAMMRSPAATRAAGLCREWGEPSRASAIHGDMKAEHLLVDDRGEIRIVDWESAGRGPRLWDRACLAQSILGQVVLGITPFGEQHRRLLQSLTGTDDPDLAGWLGLRLWQASVEWTSEQTRSTSPATRMFLFGEKLLNDPSSIRSLAQLTA